MKKYLLGLTFAAASTLSAQASTINVQAVLNLVSKLDAAHSAKNVINWKIGDFQDHKITMMSFLNGTAHKQVTSEEGNAVWVKTDMSIMGQKQTQEMLFDRATGRVLKTRVNGQEQAPGADAQMDIIEQSETQVTVPAGTYDCMYVKAKITQDGQATEIEAWVNPVDVNIDGQLKIVAQTQMGELKMELTQFGTN